MIVGSLQFPLQCIRRRLSGRGLGGSSDGRVAEGGVRLSWMSKGTGSPVDTEGDGERKTCPRTELPQKTSLWFRFSGTRVKNAEKKESGDVDVAQEIFPARRTATIGHHFEGGGSRHGGNE